VSDYWSDIIRKFKKKGGDSPIGMQSDVVGSIRNWYADRYVSLLIQRNILIAVLFLLSMTFVPGVMAIRDISLKKTIEPFLVEIEERSGQLNVVLPVTDNVLLADESLNRYFLYKYLKARETYNAIDYKYNYDTVVRLLSSGEVYGDFRNIINDDKANPAKIYGDTGATNLKIRSFQSIGSGKVQVRFAIEESGRNIKGTQNKIAIIEYKYTKIQMTQDQLYINPVGFVVTRYKLDDEII
jgi:type IV secretion system protein VirB8